MILRRLTAAFALTAAALPAAAAEPEFFLAGIGQLSGVYATSPAPGGERWNAFAGYAFGGDMEVTTDSGLKYGLSATIGSGDYERSLDRPGTNEKITVNEAYVFLRTVYGQVRVGDEDGTAHRAVDLLPLIGGGQVDGYWQGVAGAAAPIDHIGRDSDDGTKILYETPRLFGLRAGVSYAWDRDSLVEDIDDIGFVPAEENFWEFGLNWRGDSGPWSYELAAGYGTGEGGAPGVEDTETVTLAGLVLYGGFSAGAVWFDGQVGLPGGGGSDTGGITLHGSYENGPYGLAVWWSDTEVDAVADHSAYGLGLSWRAWQPVTLGLDVVRYDRALVGAQDDDKGIAVQASVTARY